MKRDCKRRSRSYSWGIYLLVMVFPLYWIVITSLKPQKDIFSFPLKYWPQKFTMDNYMNIFKISKFHIYIGNSLIVAIIAALIVLVISVLSAYVLARFKFRGHRQIMLAFFLTQMLPGFIALAPLYLHDEQDGPAEHPILARAHVYGRADSVLDDHAARILPADSRPASRKRR